MSDLISAYVCKCGNCRVDKFIIVKSRGKYFVVCKKCGEEIPMPQEEAKRLLRERWGK